MNKSQIFIILEDIFVFVGVCQVYKWVDQEEWHFIEMMIKPYLKIVRAAQVNLKAFTTSHVEKCELAL